MKKAIVRLLVCAAYAHNIVHAKHGDCPGIQR